MSGNEISFNEDTTSGSPTHGIFVAECESLHVYSNHIEAEQSGLFGIRMDGILGPFAVLRAKEHPAAVTTSTVTSEVGKPPCATLLGWRRVHVRIR